MPPTFNGTCSGEKPCGEKPCGSGCWYHYVGDTHASAASKCVGCTCKFASSGQGKGFFYCDN